MGHLYGFDREAEKVLNGEARPTKQATLLLALLGPFFFVSYGFATWYTSRLASVPSVVFGWERAIPFWPWTIVPYWTIDIFYAISFYLCVTREELYTHAKRLFAVQLISVGFFLLVPLRFSFTRPPMEGIFGSLFAALEQFDKPFNQAPSLHISLLLLLWLRFDAHLGRLGRFLLHAFFALIGLSVLTTWQHHFIDLPTGFAAGALCVALFPDERFRQHDRRRFRLAAFYAAIALAIGVAAFGLGTLHPAALWLFWPAASLVFVGVIYLRGFPGGFGKVEGKLSLPMRVALWPYLVAAFVNSRLWTRHTPAAVEIADGVWLGRIPSRKDLAQGRFGSLVDCVAELSVARGDLAYQAVPMLDLLVPEHEQLAAAAAAIEGQAGARPTLVFCALGYSRSASAVAAWLLATGRAKDVAQATEQIAAAKPNVVLGSAHHAALEAFQLESLKARKR